MSQCFTKEVAINKKVIKCAFCPGDHSGTQVLQKSGQGAKPIDLVKF